MTRSERGSATLYTVFAAVLLLTALAAATLWSAVSTARHKLTAAADLTALSAAQSLATAQSPTTTPTEPATATPCASAARTAALNTVQLAACEVTSTAVTVRVSVRLDLPLAHPTLTTTARAGPL